MRITPPEIVGGNQGDSQIGSSKLAGIHKKILAGNPAAAGFYLVLLFVPAQTKIQAHSHRDNRMAAVVGPLLPRQEQLHPMNPWSSILGRLYAIVSITGPAMVTWDEPIRTPLRSTMSL
jgi:hypothetical protein